jgi:hypothetical protein
MEIMKKAIAAAALATAVAVPASAAVYNDGVWYHDLGVLGSQARVPSVVTGTLFPNDLVFVSFVVPNDLTAGNGGFLDITSNDTSFSDTEIGLYAGAPFNAAAPLVTFDDDDGLGLKSTLSFGAGSGLTLGDPGNLGGDGIGDGEDGNLPAGQYTLVFGEFNVEFGSVLSDAVSTGPDVGGDYEIDFFFAIPEPASAGLLGVAGLGLLARRRK